MKAKLAFLLMLGTASIDCSTAQTNRVMQFSSSTEAEAVRWQQESRKKLFELMMGGSRPSSGPLNPVVMRREEAGTNTYVLEELTLQSLPDRKVHAWLAIPKKRLEKVGAVLALNGHGGNGEQVIRGQGLYWYGRALAERGYVVIAPDIGQHTLQYTNWSLMGERTWDALRCIDFLVTRPEVDAQRIAVAGLSLGGETTMYVAALDPRVSLACSSGWLTTISNMKQGHCPCWKFPGLEANFDFADIFACFAPRPMVLEIGEQERAPGGFPVSVAQRAFTELRTAYGIFHARDQVELVVHPGGHVFHGERFLQRLAGD